MKKTLTLISIIFSVSAMSAGYQTVEKSFTVTNIGDMGARVYYACDSVEHQTEAILEQLGATVFSVKCTGGLDTFGRFHTPARVTVSFEAPNNNVEGSLSTVYDVVKIKEFDNCHLNNKIVDGVKDGLDILNIKTRRCLRPNDRTRIEVSILTVE